MKRPWTVVVPVVFYAALAVFLVIYLATIDWSSLTELQLDPLWLTSSTVVTLVAVFGFVYIWGVILRSIGAPIRISSTLVLVYAKAWLGRYIPGKAPWILGKIYFASREGIPRSKLAVSSLLEAALQVVAAFAISVVLLLADRRLDSLGVELTVLLGAVFVVCIVAVLPPVFNRLLRLAFRLLRRELPEVDEIRWRTIGSAGALYIVTSVISGFSLFLLAKALDPGLGWGLAVYITGAGILAGALGMVAIFAPSGLGVRDGLLILLLSLVMPTELALAVTIVSRLWNLVVDVLFVGIAWAVARLSGGADRRGAPSAAE